MTRTSLHGRLAHAILQTILIDVLHPLTSCVVLDLVPTLPIQPILFIAEDGVGGPLIIV